MSKSNIKTCPLQGVSAGRAAPHELAPGPGGGGEVRRERGRGAVGARQVTNHSAAYSHVTPCSTLIGCSMEYPGKQDGDLDLDFEDDDDYAPDEPRLREWLKWVVMSLWLVSSNWL